MQMKFLETCPTCKGTRVVMVGTHTLGGPRGSTEVACGDCNGVGAKLTEEGKEVRRLMESVARWGIKLQ
jgi:DnaJ-class molecular chaperone